MDIFKRLRDFFMGKALAASADPFEAAKIKVLFNFSVFTLLSNLPYTIISFSSHIAIFASAIVQNVTVCIVLFLIAGGKRIQLAIKLFLLNFICQNTFHFIVNNGRMLEQGLLFQTLVVLFTFILMGYLHGWLMFLIISIFLTIGIYNQNSGFSLFRFPDELADPPLAGNMMYMIILVIAMNVYLVSEFVKAQGQAQKILTEQKKLVELKNKEVTDSITYSKRIQNSLMPTLKYIDKTLKRMRNEN